MTSVERILRLGIVPEKGRRVRVNNPRLRWHNRTGGFAMAREDGKVLVRFRQTPMRDRDVWFLASSLEFHYDEDRADEI